MPPVRSRRVVLASPVIVLALTAAVVGARAADAPPQAQRADAPDMEVLPLRPNVHLVAGAGGNVTVQIGDDGVLIVDTGSVATAPAILSAVRRITQAPIRYVIDTSADVDHAGGNALVAAAGQSFGIRPNEIPFGP